MRKIPRTSQPYSAWRHDAMSIPAFSPIAGLGTHPLPVHGGLSLPETVNKLPLMMVHCKDWD